MEEKSLKQKILDRSKNFKHYITHKKKESRIISIAIVLCIIAGFIVKLNNGEVISYAKRRSTLIEGETITDIV